MRALLVLYMVGVLKLGEVYGAGRYADCYALIELGGVLGALAADQLIGMRRALILGGLLMSAGYLFLATGLYSFLGFSLVIVGLSLFTPNLLAHLSQKNGEAGKGGLLAWVILLLNAGTYFATPLCALFSQHQVWVSGFWVASLGTSLASVSLLFFNPLEVKEEKQPLSRMKATLILALVALFTLGVVFGVSRPNFSLPLLPWAELLVFTCLLLSLWRGGFLKRSQVALLGLYLLSLIFFYGFEERLTSLASSLSFAGAPLGGFLLGSTLLVTLNPLLVFSLEGPLDGLCREGGRPFLKLALSFCIGALAFGLLSLGNSLFLTAGGVSFISIGEVLIGSLVYWFCFRLAPKHRAHVQVKFFCLLSLVFSLAVSFGNKTCKALSQGLCFSTMQLALILALLGFLLALMGYFTQRKVVT